MLALYLLAGIYVLLMNWTEIPGLLALIISAAFSQTEATGAFIGGTMGYAFLFGMKRALFSNEAGQGTSPMAHSAAKTDEPVREGIVAGLEPFIDTIVVCTVTALVILSTGIWNRPAEARLSPSIKLEQVADGQWSLRDLQAPNRANGGWEDGDDVYVIVRAHENPQSGNDLHRLDGTVTVVDGIESIAWSAIATDVEPELDDAGIYASYVGATLTAKAFDTVIPGLGKWLVTLAVWLFALSTCISWSYYGEQSAVYLAGDKAVLPYKIIFCALTIVATMDFIKTDAQLDNLTGIGTGVMLFVNVPIMWLLGSQAMLAYNDYVKRFKTGRIGAEHPPPTLEDLISGRDVED
jgi:AGCS family alanine or glycine:cation symporter